MTNELGFINSGVSAVTNPHHEFQRDLQLVCIFKSSLICKPGECFLWAFPRSQGHCPRARGDPSLLSAVPRYPKEAQNPSGLTPKVHLEHFAELD